MDQLPLPENPSERYKFEVLFQNKFQILELNETNIKIRINNQEYHMIKAVAYPIIEKYAYDRVVVGKFIVPRNNNVEEIMQAVRDAGGLIEN